MPLIASLSSLRKRHPVLTYGGAGLLIIIALVGITRVMITPVAKAGIIDWLEDHGVSATIDDIKLDISGGRLSLLGFDAHNDAGQGARIGVLELGWEWDRLTDKWLVVNRIVLEDFHLDALLYADGKMNIGGLQLPLPPGVSAPDVVLQEEKQEQSKPFDISLTSIRLSNISACVKQFDVKAEASLDYCATMKGFDWNGDIHYTLNPQVDSGDMPLNIKGTLGIKGISAQNNTLQRKLISIDNVSLETIQLSGLSQLSLEQISVDGLSALERAKHDDANNAQVLAFQNMRINGISLREMNALVIDTIVLTDAASYVEIKKDGKFEFDEWLPKESEAKTNEPAQEKIAENDRENKNKTFQYSLGRLEYKSSRPISYVDNSLKEIFAITLPKTELELGPIDSRKPEALTHIKLYMLTGKQAEVKLDANMNPLNAKPDLDGEASIAGLDLRMVSPLTRQYIGHSIRSGQLDSKLTLKAKSGVLDSKVSLTLNQFELRALNKQEAEELNSELGFPLSSSLSLLRDSDNRIVLNIPITGDINKPDFDPADAIKTATSKAISTAVLYYYTPFGLVLAADALFDLATALRFDPMIFAAGKGELEQAHKVQLDSIANMLIERPGVHLTLCGNSNKADVTVLLPEIISAAEKSETKAIVLNKEQQQKMLQLAEQRGDAVKQYLTQQKKIAASRLVVCEPQYQQDANKPVVEISI